MKFLRNPIATGILVVIAILVVYLQIAPHLHLGFGSPAHASISPSYLPPRTPAPPPPAQNPAPSQTAAATNVEEVVTPKIPIDKEFVGLHFDGWVNWPQRDPFLVMTPDPPESKNKDTDANSPVASWKLRAIWAQTASRPIAVINQRVYREGDEILGYKIIKIEGDEVWFQGPRRKERLGLDRRMPAHP